MKLVILCLCLASTASAAPSPFHYMSHYTGSRQQLPPSQVTDPYSLLKNVVKHYITVHYSSLIFSLQPQHGFLKYSIPQPPGRQSVEIVLFSLIKLFVFFVFFQIPSFDANPLPSQDPLQPLQQDQPTQINQAIIILNITEV
uniref:Secretory calcium-binding phosphoprotein 5 n=1 Tax=Seriola dumerili TaxID=41447 RepID=A0A3B4T8I8_SERDU